MCADPSIRKKVGKGHEQTIFRRNTNSQLRMKFFSLTGNQKNTNSNNPKIIILHLPKWKSLFSNSCAYSVLRIILIGTKT